MSHAPQIEGDRIALAGVDLRCSHCDGDAFVERSALLNTRGMTWLGLEWLNDGARVFVCTRCGHLEWFAELDDTGTPATEIRCLSCGTIMAAPADRCDECGWSYAEHAGAGAGR